MHAKVAEAREKMHKAVAHMQEEFAGIRTGRSVFESTQACDVQPSAICSPFLLTS